MNVPFFAAVLLLVILTAVGWPGARRLGRTPAWSVAVTPAVAGLVAAGSVMASIVTRTSLVPWLVLVALIGWAALVHRRGRHGQVLVPDDPGGAVLAVAAAAALLPVVLVDLPPVESDARFIWWFHAAWFRGGGEVARDGMAHSSFAATHSGYPPLAPGLVASAWHLAAAYDREVALRVSQLVTAAFIAAAGFFVAGTLRLPRRGAMAAAALVVAVAWGTNPSVGLTGFVDLTWAALFLTAGVLLLAGPTDRRTIAVGAAFAAAAALTKFEGGAAALLLVGLCTLRAGTQWRRAVPAVAAVVASLVAWVGVSTVAEVPTDDRGDWSALTEVFDPGSVVHDRVVDTLGHLADELGPMVGLGVLAVVALVVLGRFAGAPLRQPGLLLLLAWCGAYLLFLTAAVGVANLPLSEYTDSGNYRTVIVVRLVVLVDVGLAAVAALRAAGVLTPANRPTSAAAGQAPTAIG